MSSLLIYLTPDLKKTLIIDSTSLPSGDTPPMRRFIACLVACKEAGYSGFRVDSQKRLDGSIFNYIEFDPSTPEGCYLLELQEDAIVGVMPPTPDKVVARVKRAYG